jgi:hypothetical protein
MNAFNVTDFIAKDGLVILIGSYTETILGCGMMVSILGVSPNPIIKEYFQYTFWLFRMPNSNGFYDTWLSCFKKERHL